MDAQKAAMALEFLARVQLAGREAPAFMAVTAALTAIAQPPAAVDDRIEKPA